MEVKQIYDFVNSATSEVLGKSNVIAEDLSNVVDVGTELFNANAVDAYVRSLVNHIGRCIFVNRPYRGGAVSLLRDGWEFGSVLEKVTADTPEAVENETWDLSDNTSYDPNVFHAPHVTAKFFNKRVTFEIEMSFTERQVKQSFSNATQLNAFMSMLYNSVERSMTIKMDALIMRTINNMIAETVNADYGNDSISSKSGIKAVNLLYLYNQRYSKSLTASDSITDPDFIRFASYVMGVYSSRLTKISSLFNVGGKDRFTPADMLHVVMLSDFRKSANVFLQSDVFHNELSALPQAEEVPFWQGSGTGYAFADIAKVYVDKIASSGDSVTVTGVLAVMFDHDAMGVTNLDRRVTTNYNPKAEFFNNFFKFEAGYYNDLNESCVVFFVA